MMSIWGSKAEPPKFPSVWSKDPGFQATVLSCLDNLFEPHRGRPLNQSLKGLLCPHVCVAITHEATARMVVQVDSHQLPDELVAMEIFTEVSSSNRLDKELLEYLVPLFS